MLLLSFVTLVYFYSVDLTITVTRSCLNLILQYHLLQFESIPFYSLCFSYYITICCNSNQYYLNAFAFFCYFSLLLQCRQDSWGRRLLYHGFKDLQPSPPQVRFRAVPPVPPVPPLPPVPPVSPALEGRNQSGTGAWIRNTYARQGILEVLHDCCKSAQDCARFCRRRCHARILEGFAGVIFSGGRLLPAFQQWSIGASLACPHKLRSMPCSNLCIEWKCKRFCQFLMNQTSYTGYNSVDLT